MAGVLLAKLDLGPVLKEVRRNGVAVVAEALADPFRRQLERELMPVPYQAAPAEVGPVRQETDVFFLQNLAGFPILAELAAEFRAAVRAHAREIRGLATYAPNEVYLQRYRPGSLGITPHLDGKRYRRLVAFFTVRGSACLSVLRERAGEEIARFSIGPGSLALLRAPGLGGLRDGRPFHAIVPVGTEERVSVGLRMDTRPRNEGGSTLRLAPPTRAERGRATALPEQSGRQNDYVQVWPNA